MIKEFIGIGESLEEATQNAIEGLAAKADEDVQIEVLSEYKKKVLGVFGGTPAKVRAYVELPDPKPKKAKEKKEKAEKKAPVKDAKPLKQEIKSEAPENLVDASELDPASSAGKATAYLKNILLNLGCENLVIKVAEIEGGAYISLEGDKLGVVIGRRGETLDAIQYLTSLAANTGSGYYKVTLNIGNYREKREQTLKALAKKVSAQVLRTGRSRSLEPMNPYERRIIHTAVQDIDGVASNSTGDGSSRRVVISPVGGEKRKTNNNRTNTQTSVREPKKDSTDVPLYGRLN
ncbi:MAG: KH domain-containing protein [Clostridia bacterium]|nr:KH domain-containing protein [Clostridia bacterium]